MERAVILIIDIYAYIFSRSNYSIVIIQYIQMRKIAKLQLKTYNNSFPLCL